MPFEDAARGLRDISGAMGALNEFIGDMGAGAFRADAKTVAAAISGRAGQGSIVAIAQQHRLS